MDDIISTALWASLHSGGGSSTIDICDWVETLPILASGSIANSYSFKIRYGSSEKPKDIFTFRKADSNYPAFWYMSNEVCIIEFYTCVYNSSNELMWVFKHSQNNAYDYRNVYNYYSSGMSSLNSYCSAEYRFKEIRVLQLYPITYNPSDLTANGQVSAQIQLMFQVDLDATFYIWDYRTMEREVQATQVNTLTTTITTTIPSSSSYSDEIFSPLTDAEYNAFLQNFTDDIIDYLSNQ